MNNSSMTYKALMKKLDNGDAHIDAWSRDGEYAIVTFYTRDGGSKRREVHITHQPKSTTAEGG